MNHFGNRAAISLSLEKYNLERFPASGNMAKIWELGVQSFPTSFCFDYEFAKLNELKI